MHVCVCFFFHALLSFYFSTANTNKTNKSSTTSHRKGSINCWAVTMHVIYRCARRIECINHRISTNNCILHYCRTFSSLLLLLLLFFSSSSFHRAHVTLNCETEASHESLFIHSFFCIRCVLKNEFYFECHALTYAARSTVMKINDLNTNNANAKWLAGWLNQIKKHRFVSSHFDKVR